MPELLKRRLYDLLSGGDLRSKGQSESAAALVNSQADFDQLFQYLQHDDRLVVMRAADAVEKITKHKPAFLATHTKTVISLAQKASDKELMWHLAQLMPRLKLTGKNLSVAWDILVTWCVNKKNSRIVRVFSLQSLFDLSTELPELRHEAVVIAQEIAGENIPSLNARIRKLLKNRETER